MIPRLNRLLALKISRLPTLRYYRRKIGSVSFLVAYCRTSLALLFLRLKVDSAELITAGKWRKRIASMALVQDTENVYSEIEITLEELNVVFTI